MGAGGAQVCVGGRVALLLERRLGEETMADRKASVRAKRRAKAVVAMVVLTVWWVCCGGGVVVMRSEKERRRRPRLSSGDHRDARL